MAKTRKWALEQATADQQSKFNYESLIFRATSSPLWTENLTTQPQISSSPPHQNTLKRFS